MGRIAVAFVLAPLAPAVLAGGLYVLLSSFVSPTSAIGGLLLITLFSRMYAVPATIVFGIPLFFWFRRRGWLRLRHIIAGGAIVGVAAGVALSILLLVVTLYRHRPGNSISWDALAALASIVVFVPYGVLMAWVFWALAFWDPKPSDPTPR